MAELLCYSYLDSVASLGSGEVDVVEAEVTPFLVGKPVSELTLQGEIHVVSITRGGRTFLPSPGTVFHKGDTAHVAVLGSSADRLKTLLDVQ